jgi:putative CocE/NonD family hydrolase
MLAAMPSWAGEGLPPPRYHDWEHRKEIMVPMRDGVRLSTDVVLPKGAEGPLPTVLVRTPYAFEKMVDPDENRYVTGFASHGYAVVIQNERGRHFSEGEYSFLAGARTDGPDTIDWIAQQPWSNGKVGTIGCSSSAEHQLGMAAANRSAHAAMIPMAAGAGIGAIPGVWSQGLFYRGGVPALGIWIWWYRDYGNIERPLLPDDLDHEGRIRYRSSFNFTVEKFFTDSTDPVHWYLPSAEILRSIEAPLTDFDQFMTLTPADPEWLKTDFIRDGDRPEVPALHVNSWYDPGISEQIKLFSYLSENGVPNQYLIIPPTSHCAMTGSTAKHKVGDRDLGDIRYGGRDQGYQKLSLDWFDYWLKGEDNGVLDRPRVEAFVMGKGWVSGDRWPLEGTDFVPYYLHSDGNANTGLGTGTLSVERPGDEPADVYRYDPMAPVPSRGGICCGADVVKDQSPNEMRADVLVYSTPPLSKGVTVLGPVEVVLYVSSSARDTDFAVKLIDVFPDGKAYNLYDDILRARYRDGYDRQVFMEEGGVYELRFNQVVTGNHFEEGHRIRIEITSSNFPNFERNLNTGGNNFDETEGVVATNIVHHSALRPSHIVLPILDGAP